MLDRETWNSEPVDVEADAAAAASGPPGGASKGQLAWVVAAARRLGRHLPSAALAGRASGAVVHGGCPERARGRLTVVR